ncbi:hypothetical protein VIGAN_03181200 [Vigna angularis var. angularis]|uniref:Uncharacterized protein n=1 Tax=Vigna angularis var. angularis TaxID=157739 RepID=A0A0S3RMT0_PHAAN|nr:hypothetical protein VIGAN_03181200 [Vigna angularis var. angularis]
MDVRYMKEEDDDDGDGVGDERDDARGSKTILIHITLLTLPLLLSRSRSDLKATTPPLRCFAFTVPFSFFLFFSLAQISFSQFLFFSILSRSNLKATTPPLRLSVATTPLLHRRHISFNASESHGCIPPRNPNPSRLPPRNPNPTTNRHPTGRDLTPPTDAILDLVLFVDRLVRPVPVVEPLA